MADEFGLGDNGGLDLEIPSGDLSLQIEDSQMSDSLRQMFGDSNSIELDVDGLNIEDNGDVSFDTEFSDWAESEEKLNSQIDMVSLLDRYLTLAKSLKTTIESAEGTSDSLKEARLPDIVEFKYIVDPKTRSDVYKYFTVMLVELVQDKKYRGMTEDEAFQYLLDEMAKPMPEGVNYSPTIYRDLMRDTFIQYYDKSKKFAAAKSMHRSSTLDSAIDVAQLDTSIEVYSVNTVPFKALNTFISDEANLSETESISPSGFGIFVSETIANGGKSDFRDTAVYHGIASYLFSKDVTEMLGLSEGAAFDFSIGDMLRRYIKHELDSGDLYPNEVAKMDRNIGVDTKSVELWKIMSEQMTNGSIAAELILLLIQIILDTPKKRVRESTLPVFVDGLIAYFQAYTQHKRYTDPIPYSFIGNRNTDAENGDVFDLGYMKEEEARVLKVNSILVEVVGDVTSIYHIPMAYTTDDMDCVVVPPDNVVSALRQKAQTGTVASKTGLCYRYSPSFTWLMTQNLVAASEDTKRDITHVEDVLSINSNNPLLTALLNYDNKFYKEEDMPKAVTIKLRDGNVAMGVNDKDSIKVLRIMNNGIGVNIKSAAAAIDDSDGSLVIDYTDADGNSEILMSDKDGYDIVKTKYSSTADAGANKYGIDRFLNSGLLGKTSKNACYLRTTAKLICQSSTLDFETELKDAQYTIAGDLAYILKLDEIDRVLAAGVIEDYHNLVSDGTDIDSFNAEYLRKLSLILLGNDSPFCNESLSIDDRINKTLEQLRTSSSGNPVNIMNDYVTYLSSIDTTVLAFQCISKNRKTVKPDMGLYNALECIPCIASFLSVLESKMVMLKAIIDMGNDTFYILDKLGPVGNFWRSYEKIAAKKSFKIACDDLRKSVKTAVRPNEETLVAYGKDCGLSERYNAMNTANAKLFVPYLIYDVSVNQIPENFALAKYFALNQNMCGLLATIEDCTDNQVFEKLEQMDDEAIASYNILSVFDYIYRKFKAELGIEESAEISKMSEEDFESKVDKSKISKVFDSYRQYINFIIKQSIIAEICSNVNMDDIKAYALLAIYGRDVFRLNNTNIDKKIGAVSDDGFLKYAGSFIASFCPVVDEGASAIDGGTNRIVALSQNLNDFKTKYPLGDIMDLGLEDFNLVESVSSAKEENEVMKDV